MNTAKTVMIGVVMLCCAASAHTAGIFRVDAASAAVTPDGQSWSTAYLTLQAGVDAASAVGGGEVWVKAGTYTATTNPVLTMKGGVSLYGGFSGVETAREQRNWPVNATVIDGEAARRCVNGAHGATLDGFTITRGNAGDGGGMYNYANSNGGGAGYCSPAVANCTFTANKADGYGGGMCNIATGSQYSYVYASPTVTNCIFKGNTAAQGGGMCNYSSASAVCYQTCSVNATAGADPALANCLFSGNTATQGGGMMNLTNAQSYYFYASAYSSASPRVINSTFSGNSGGAMNNNCTRNDSPGSATHAWANVTNCILWGDLPATTPEITNSANSVPVVTWSCVQGGYAGTGNISADPQFLAAPDDLRLQQSSPCIDAGTVTGAPATDIEGASRPQGAGVDMGAYEADKTPPAITACAANHTVPANASCQALVPDFTAGVTATDNHDLHPTITQSPGAGTAVGLGDTTVTLTVTDNAGNFAACPATLTVADVSVPVITLNGSAAVTIECGVGYTDAGANASDTCAGDLTAGIVTLNPVDRSVPGVYTVRYNVNDGHGNSAQEVTRTVTVLPDLTPPVIAVCAPGRTLRTNPSSTVPVPDFRADVTATDNSGGTLTATQSPPPGTLATLGEYAVTLTVTDTSGNAAACETTLRVFESLVYCVDPTATGVEDGQGWPTAFHTLQPAIDAAHAVGGSEVWVAGGAIGVPLVYNEERTEVWGSPAAIPGSLVMKSGVALYGGFEGYRSGAGAQETTRDQRNHHRNVTVIDGGTARAGNPAYHVVVFGSNAGATVGAILDGFIIVGGNASGVVDDYHTWRGGGVYNWQSKPVISNCIFRGNTAAVSGGAVSNETNGNNDAGAQFVNCMFYANYADRAADTALNPVRGGGAVFNNKASAVFIGCTIANNSVGNTE